MSNNMKRRDFIKNSALLAAGGLVLASLPGSAKSVLMPSAGDELFSLPPLPYGYDALEPFIDKATMEIHHSKHHQAYITNLNKALAGKSEYKDITELCRTIHDGNFALRNNGGGHFNHSFFWKLLKPPVNGQPAPAPTGKLADAITATFGSMEAFKTKFSEKSKAIFGSGWCWLIVSDVYKLEITTTANQDNPLMLFAESKGSPILALDIWEHAYYLKHQNKRADYIADWWNVVNWEEAEKLYVSSKR
jgi:Fe-Mn family superoxide dismutase